MPVTRYDFAQIRGVRKTPSGGIRADAYVTRAGVFAYRRADGSTRLELRPPEEVFHADSLASLSDAAVTDLHPSGTVDAKNWREHSIGHVRDGARRDGEFVAAEVVVNDAGAIAKIEAKDRREVSCGYTCDLEEKAGIYQGERFDAIQRNIRYNHVALGPKGWGRAGSEVALRLDGNDAALDSEPHSKQDTSAPRAPETKGPKMKAKIRCAKIAIDEKLSTFRVDGVDFALKGEGAKHAERALLAAQDRTVEDVARADGAENAGELLELAHERIAELERQVLTVGTAAANAPEPRVDAAEIDRLVAERLALLERAKTLAPGAKFEGLTNRAIMETAVKARRADAKLDGASDDFVRGVFESLSVETTEARREDARDEVRLALVPKTKDQEERAITLESVRADSKRALANAWKGAAQK